MSKSNTFENDMLALFFNGTPIAGLASNAVSAPLTLLYLQLHSADPGEAGNQETNEIVYGGYARKAAARSTAGFTVSNNTVTFAVDQDFPACTSGTASATHFSVGTAATGPGKIMYKGTVTPTIAVSAGTTPGLGTGTTISED